MVSLIPFGAFSLAARERRRVAQAGFGLGGAFRSIGPVWAKVMRTIRAPWSTEGDSPVGGFLRYRNGDGYALPQ
jgi:hypothetical protein